LRAEIVPGAFLSGAQKFGKTASGAPKTAKYRRKPPSIGSSSGIASSAPSSYRRLTNGR
jgi:hypothetical protein